MLLPLLLFLVSSAQLLVIAIIVTNFKVVAFAADISIINGLSVSLL
jgi:hypothetical protein